MLCRFSMSQRCIFTTRTSVSASFWSRCPSRKFAKFKFLCLALRWWMFPFLVVCPSVMLAYSKVLDRQVRWTLRRSSWTVFFRTFPRERKSAKVALQPAAELVRHSSPSTSSAHGPGHLRRGLRGWACWRAVAQGLLFCVLGGFWENFTHFLRVCASGLEFCVPLVPGTLSA